MLWVLLLLLPCCVVWGGVSSNILGTTGYPAGGRAYHCAGKLNETAMLVVGGIVPGNQYSRDILLLRLDTGVWTQVGLLDTAMAYHVCSVFLSYNGTRYLGIYGNFVFMALAANPTNFTFQPPVTLSSNVWYKVGMSLVTLTASGAMHVYGGGVAPGGNDIENYPLSSNFNIIDPLGISAFSYLADRTEAYDRLGDHVHAVLALANTTVLEFIHGGIYWQHQCGLLGCALTREPPTTVLIGADTWIKTPGGNWQRLSYSVKPEARFSHSSVMDPETSSFYIFGGVGATGVILDDMWRFVLCPAPPCTGWSSSFWELISDTAASARQEASLVLIRKALPLVHECVQVAVYGGINGAVYPGNVTLVSRTPEVLSVTGCEGDRECSGLPCPTTTLCIPGQTITISGYFFGPTPDVKISGLQCGSPTIVYVGYDFQRTKMSRLTCKLPAGLTQGPADVTVIGCVGTTTFPSYITIQGFSIAPNSVAIDGRARAAVGVLSSLVTSSNVGVLGAFPSSAVTVEIGTASPSLYFPCTIINKTSTTLNCSSSPGYSTGHHMRMRQDIVSSSFNYVVYICYRYTDPAAVQIPTLAIPPFDFGYVTSFRSEIANADTGVILRFVGNITFPLTNNTRYDFTSAQPGGLLEFRLNNVLIMNASTRTSATGSYIPPPASAPVPFSLTYFSQTGQNMNFTVKYGTAPAQSVPTTWLSASRQRVAYGSDVISYPAPVLSTSGLCLSASCDSHASSIRAPDCDYPPLIQMVGQNFGIFPSALDVTFGPGLRCAVTALNNSNIECQIPNGAGNNHTFRVAVGNQVINGTDHFSYCNGQIVVDAVVCDPACYTRGRQTLMITGTGFGTNQSIISVKVGTKDCSALQLVVPDLVINCTSPPGAGVVEVKVKVGTRTGVSGFVQFRPPQILGVTVDSLTRKLDRKGNTSLVLFGEDFGDPDVEAPVSVSIGPVSCMSVNLDVTRDLSFDYLTCVAPPGKSKDNSIFLVQYLGFFTFAAQLRVDYDQCQPGYVEQFGDLTGCDECAPGKFSDVEGQTQCTDCSPGTYRVVPGPASVCLACQGGTYQPEYGQILCMPCAPGSANPSPNQLACTACVAGTYSDSPSAYICPACPAGTVQPNVSGIACDPCQPGFTTSSPGQVECAPCAGGKYSFGTNSSECQDCTAGKFQNASGRSLCFECELGMFQDKFGQTTCQGCADDSFLSRQIGNFEHQCSTCAKVGYAATCAGGIAKAKPGYWLYEQPLGNGVSELLAFRCSPPTACLECTNYPSLLEANSSVCNKCSDDRRKPFSRNVMCGMCPPGMVDANGVCIVCNEVSWGIIVLLVLASWLYVLIFFKVSQSSSGETKIFLFFCQTCLLTLNPYSQAYTQQLSVFDFDFLSLSQNQCALPVEPIGRLYVRMSLPLILGAELFLTFWIHMGIWYCANRTCRKGGRRMSVAGLAAVRKFRKSPYIRTLLALILFCYNSLSKTVLSALGCEDVGGQASVLKTIPGVDCLIPEYTTLQIVAIVLLMLWVVLVPLALSCWVYSIRKIINDEMNEKNRKIKERYAVIYMCYKTQCYWWESYAMFRRTVLIAVVVIFSDQHDMQIALALCLFVFLMMQFQFNPFRTEKENIAEKLSLSFLLCLTIVLSSIDELTKEAAITISVFVYLALLVFLFHIGRHLFAAAKHFRTGITKTDDDMRSTTGLALEPGELQVFDGGEDTGGHGSLPSHEVSASDLQPERAG